MQGIRAWLRFERLLLLLILVLMVGLVMIRISPLASLPSRDSGFFLYAGGQILKGKLPYIDFWDSKPPGIFYLNALGLWLGGGSRWGVWLLEFLFLVISAALFHRSIARKWGRGAALFANAAWLYGLARVWEGGNLTEEYALLFNFMLLAYFLQVDGTAGKKLSLLIGASFAISFCLRANNTGVQMAIVLALLLSTLAAHQYGRLLQSLGWAVLAGGAVLGLVCVYFLRTGTFTGMFEAAVLYNFFYAGAAQGLQLNLWRGIERIGWPAYVALGAYALVAFQRLRGRRKFLSDPVSNFLLIGPPLEALLSSLSGRNYAHYFISWMPVLAALNALAWSMLFKTFPSQSMRQFFSSRTRGLALVVLGLLPLYIISGTAREYRNTATRVFFEPEKGIERSDSLAQFLREHTNAEQTVLIWGAYPLYYYLAGRDAPTPYLYYPAYEQSPYLEQMGRAYFQDLSSARPRLIVDAYQISPDYVLSLDPAVRRLQAQHNADALYRPPYQDDVFAFVAAHYRRLGTIDGFDVYAPEAASFPQ